MKRRPIHRGGILSAGYNPQDRYLDVEFDTHRIMRAEGVGFETADRFLNSGSPLGYWQDEIVENYTVREISKTESEAEPHKPKKNMDDLKRLFGDL